MVPKLTVGSLSVVVLSTTFTFILCVLLLPPMTVTYAEPSDTPKISPFFTLTILSLLVLHEKLEMLALPRLLMLSFFASFTPMVISEPSAMVNSEGADAMDEPVTLSAYTLWFIA